MSLPFRHPYSDQAVHFGTHHQKDRLAIEPFAQLGMTVVGVDIDSDQLGTFSGEVDRFGTIRETLREKIKLTQNILPNGRFYLASEGAFGPHPLTGFTRTDYESLLFVDQQTSVEIFVEHLSTEVIHDELEISQETDLTDYLSRNLFPSHAQIISAVDQTGPIFKGLVSWDQLSVAAQTCIEASPAKKALLQTDLRACYNPTRQKVIKETLVKLCDALLSFCPECHSPGYRIVNAVPGLPCLACGEPSSHSHQVIFECPQCLMTRLASRPDGVRGLNPEECQFCNP